MPSSLMPLGVLLSAASQVVLATSQGPSCKCLPSDDCWPSSADWAALNSTIDGQLIQGQPPASVCYPDEPNYNVAACQDILDSSWTSSAWHAANPVSIDGPDPQQGCYPIYGNGTDTIGNPLAGEQGCATWAYPAYVVNATKEEYIQAGVRFASKHNLRLNVKDTGHGSQHSQTPGSLSIWTHALQDVEFIENFVPTGSKNDTSAGRLAMRFGAGMQDRTAFEAAAEHDVVVGGLLVVDIEARVVTASGDLVIANEAQNCDLLWGIRGGGHGLAGVITSLTVKA
ncbi:Putative FAD-binding, type PCMH, subdomain 2, FAD-binding, type PCMH-like superfamily [Septoria linicola]|uniref:FAD-binding, type PCMH, subdomain 2, FAD-binding, type PCMH-like superfamily n=1 Tax=Septoria linicola TaxID=215465 RepID=A0A9Q9AML6_9PEZI|nr:putative FAD-binding, type PCMH, subdomain 2, FAD-binding, type PCMH-like superfamily [Septoria linicola]USW48726.1 Putative FAD-binding, type PCMH, subdomain 2, FAD-binding, type PCMH-like superfamily [Septoria linicola]